MDAHILLRRRFRTLLAVMLGGMLAVCAACTAKEPEKRPVPPNLERAIRGTPPAEAAPDPWAQFYRYRAFAAWSCKKAEPIVFVRVDIDLTPEEQLAVLRHEAAHVLLMQSLPDCGSFQAWASDAENRLTMEALGACAQIRQEVRDGGHPLAARARAVSSLAHSYGLRVSYERAQRRLMAVCP